MDDDQEPLQASGLLTWYDTRRNLKHRSSEYRLYYRDNPVTKAMRPGDLLVVAVRPDDSLFLILAARGSTSEQQIRWLFGIDEAPVRNYDVQDVPRQRSVSMLEAAILEKIGVDMRLDDENWIDQIIAKFGLKFPATDVFSTWARESCPVGLHPSDDLDATLMSWVRHEEMLFRTLERQIVEQQLKSGFDDVDHFVQFSLSVQNRRKSRAGYALEHHLKAIFDECDLAYEWQATTENRTKVDFIFPDSGAYHHFEYPRSELAMLASKSTCKDRWRQVLAEAKRIPRKHLLTLEPAISIHQTTEMREHNLRLVVPREIHLTYQPLQRDWLMDMEQFIELARDKTRRFFLVS